MDRFTLLSTLKDYAADNSWHFISGNNFIQNYEASQNDYATDQLVLACDMDAAPVFGEANQITEIRYTGVIALGQKFEDTTEASLDETFIQKYERRLENLMTLLTTALVTIACDNELTIQDVRYRMQLNKFDTVIDFVAADVTLIQ